MMFNSPDPQPFPEVLRRTNFYPEVKAMAGDQAWALLTKYVGPLA